MLAKRRVERQADARPDLAGQIAQQAEGLAHAADPGDKPGELIDQFARADDQRADAGADQRPAQERPAPWPGRAPTAPPPPCPPPSARP
jgi:hypothetical protein